MPYVNETREAELIKDAKVANCAGDYNALFTMAYLKEYIANPKYQAIHDIRKAVYQPQTSVAVMEVEAVLTQLNISMIDRIVARDLAFVEFYDRVGRQHENLAKRKNGDLQLYKEAEKVLHAKALELVQAMAVKVNDAENTSNDSE